MGSRGAPLPDVRPPHPSRQTLQWSPEDMGTSGYPLISLLKYPYPFRAALAISNDTDGMNYGAYRDWHDFVCGKGETRYGAGLGLEVADSFWYWCWPVHGGIALFQNTPLQDEVRSKEHEALLELARLGYLDTLHGFGDWREEDLHLNRDQMSRALDYLGENRVVLRNYVNHGGLNMTHNIGGAWGYYQHGDDPEHQSYCLDLLLEAGFRYFWTDVMFESGKFGDGFTWVDSKSKQAVLQTYNMRRFINARTGDQARDISLSCASFEVGTKEEILDIVFDNTFLPIQVRDGNRILGFKRYRGEYPPNSANFAHQVSHAKLKSLVENQGVVVVYQHFGVWKPFSAPPKDGRSAKSSKSPLLDDNCAWSFRFLAEWQERGDIFITTTQRLLDYLRVRDKVLIHTEQHGETLQIVLSSVECPVYGPEPITPSNAQGLTFAVEGNPAKIVITDGAGLELPIDRHQSASKAIVTVPWQRLQYPFWTRQTSDLTERDDLGSGKTPASRRSPRWPGGRI